MKKWIYSFDKFDKEDIDLKDYSLMLRELLGNKGAGLVELNKIGICVPPGFIISTEVCKYYFKHKEYPKGFEEELDENIIYLESKTGRKFSSNPGDIPLLVSVRSGAVVSMPGMMDTILNLGINDEVVKILAKLTNTRFAYDTYRRFIQMFAKVVLGSKIDFEELIKELKYKKNKYDDIELTDEDLMELVEIYKEELMNNNLNLPQDPKEQLNYAIKAVFESWNNQRAITYRKLHNIPDDLGTAAIVQAMVFGNLSNKSGTGVAFTRDPTTGKNTLFGEYLEYAQGEDVVAGIRTPSSIQKLKEDMPEVFSELLDIRSKLERYYKDMQDIEFTVENCKLYMLQTRSGKRTPKAAIKIAVDMAKEGIITKEEAILRITPQQINQLLHKQIPPMLASKLGVIATGLGASPGAASGKIVLKAETAQEYKEKNIPCILVRRQTSPDDIAGIAAAEGVLTATGGMTSHAAVVTRGMGKPCIVGCSALKIKEEEGIVIINEKVFREGEFITIDGGNGSVIAGKVDLEEPQITDEAYELLSWADEIGKLGIRANADTKEEVRRARQLGARGIGLCRTEHMFFGEERLPIMQKMILSTTEKEREEALKELQPIQKQDFIEIFKEMIGFEVCIRLLDPPLHEFLPNEEELRDKKDKKSIALLERVKALKEINPMLGFRGCRLGILYPQITKMQVSAIFEAACELTAQGYEVKPEIMVPLVSTPQELRHQRLLIEKIAEDIMQKYNIKIKYKIGTMIELPRAALVADKIAKYADFFSFGTNDLTQTTFGISRDDAEGKFLDRYLEEGIFTENPFAVLDIEGVGELMKIGISKGRSVNKDLKIGICGEHGGDPKSIEFCHKIGLDYISCSSYRLPIARLSAAKASLLQNYKRGVKQDENY